MAATLAARSAWFPLTLCLLVLCSRSLGAPPGNPLLAVSPPPRAIVVQNFYYALPGKADEVYAWRIHASDVRVRLGLSRGRILRRMHEDRSIGSASDTPDVIWECEYASIEARAADVARLNESRDFAAVERHMDTLIRDFRRVVFEAESPVPARH